MNKMNNEDINSYLPSILNPRAVRKYDGNYSLTQNSVVSRSSLSLKRRSGLSKPTNIFKKSLPQNKTVIDDLNNLTVRKLPFIKATKIIPDTAVNESQNIEKGSSISFSDIDDLKSEIRTGLGPLGLCDVDSPNEKYTLCKNKSIVSVSSSTELNDKDTTLIDKPQISITFTINDCEKLNLGTKNSNLKEVLITNNNRNIGIDCKVVEDSVITCSSESEVDENMNTSNTILQEDPTVTVNLEIKKRKLSTNDKGEHSKVLFLNTNAIGKLSHVIIQPPKYKLVKQVKLDKRLNKSGLLINSSSSALKNGKKRPSDKLKQKTLDSFFRKTAESCNIPKISDPKSLFNPDGRYEEPDPNNVNEMNKNLDVVDIIKFNRLKHKGGRSDALSPISSKLPASKLSKDKPGYRSFSDALPKGKSEGTRSASPRHKIDSIAFSVPSPNNQLVRGALSPTNIPYYKIVAGTHFAVDAFSYGDIPNVKYYFLTHFHSDHYSGLKKSFNKKLFCSEITGTLCLKRLGVSSKHIQIIKQDETINVDGVEVTALDANHCPGAIMLVFTLPNGKTILHTGDFRATIAMESYPIFWNKDIHTIYLDTTYCNPRYNFPSQEQSLDMALTELRKKKMAVEKAGKKFSSVLIICGTYTIGKEKFFLGIARRLGCLVWACPEKDKVLQTVEGASFCKSPPQSCQLHVVPMRDLTHERLKAYLDSLNGAFAEVVAFKPSGWENCKNSTTQKDVVTIHGIPYSEHSSFSELIRFVKFLHPKQVVPTVDLSGGVKAVQKYFPCPLVCKEDIHSQSKVTDYFSMNNRQQSAVT